MKETPYLILNMPPPLSAFPAFTWHFADLKYDLTGVYILRESVTYSLKKYFFFGSNVFVVVVKKFSSYFLLYSGLGVGSLTFKISSPARILSSSLFSRRFFAQRGPVFYCPFGARLFRKSFFLLNRLFHLTIMY